MSSIFYFFANYFRLSVNENFTLKVIGFQMNYNYNSYMNLMFIGPCIIAITED